MDVINDIADQTNLLALNTAISSRAGEAGRALPWLPTVRKLAEKTIGATKQVEKIFLACKLQPCGRHHLYGSAQARWWKKPQPSHTGRAECSTPFLVLPRKMLSRRSPSPLRQKSSLPPRRNQPQQPPMISRLTSDTTRGQSESAAAIQQLAEMSEPFGSNVWRNLEKVVIHNFNQQYQAETEKVSEMYTSCLLGRIMRAFIISALL